MKSPPQRVTVRVPYSVHNGTPADLAAIGVEPVPDSYKKLYEDTPYWYHELMLPPGWTWPSKREGSIFDERGFPRLIVVEPLHPAWGNESAYVELVNVGAWVASNLCRRTFPSLEAAQFAKLSDEEVEALVEQLERFVTARDLAYLKYQNPARHWLLQIERAITGRR